MPGGTAGPRPEDELQAIYREHIQRVEEIDRLLVERVDVSPTGQALYIGLAALALTGLIGGITVLLTAEAISAVSALSLVAASTISFMALLYLSSLTNPARRESATRRAWTQQRLAEADRYARELRNYRDRLQELPTRLQHPELAHPDEPSLPP